MKNQLIIIIPALFFLFILPIKAQEGRPDIPPSDEPVREQTEQTKPPGDTSSLPSYTARLKALDEQFERIKKLAKSSGRDSGRKYVELIHEYEKYKNSIENKTKAVHAEEITTEGKEIENNFQALEKILNRLANEISTIEADSILSPRSKPDE